ncbi:hypothetical protein [Dyadobacter jiangsuensis]|uniref:Uncharacterized protein n=1 Tax=Dyadobacter jiangsuensis TaxID=1591085 RepID=A0A2P8GC50_9BACT|nr:hypothetical protein [Dyadobacter jiangsuensis]PSL31549.1 hypothetical protein CLV60_103415 [Dyadobacter jiangsuensis]
MQRLLLPLLLLVLGACDKGHLIDDDAARLRGEYSVQSYVVNHDTLFSAGRINKIDVTDFKVNVSRKSADSLSIWYSWIRKSKPNAVLIRQLRLSGKDDQYQLARSSAPPLFYEGTISRGVYTEHTSLAGLGFILLPDNYPLEGTSEPGGGRVEIVARREE